MGLFNLSSGRLIGAKSAPQQREHRPDYMIFGIYLVLLLLALVIIYSISPALASLRGEGRTANWYVLRQLFFSGAAIVCFLVASRIHPKLLYRLATVAFLLASASMILVSIPGIGIELQGARRWISVSGVSLQPVELFKLGLLVYFAKFFAVRVSNNTISQASYTVMPIVIIMGIASMVVTVLQKDLGSTVVMASMIIGMMYFSSMPKLHIAAPVVAAIGAGFISIITFPHRMDRLNVFLNSGADELGVGYHLNQAYVAIGSGGIWGKGLGQSVQVHGYLPESANDSIFAIMAEKFGFIGSCIVVVIYAILLMRIINISDRSSDPFIRLVCAAVFSWLFAHVIMNVGAMTGLIPITGITLPIISYGGSSLLAMSVALGLVFNASRFTRRIAVGVSGSNKRPGESR